MQVVIHARARRSGRCSQRKGSMNSTAIALTGCLAGSAFLLVLMESIRSKLVLTTALAPNGIQPRQFKSFTFMQRLARAYANCVQGLCIFGGLMLVAVMCGQSSTTDPLAP